MHWGSAARGCCGGGNSQHLTASGGATTAAKPNGSREASCSLSGRTSPTNHLRASGTTHHSNSSSASGSHYREAPALFGTNMASSRHLSAVRRQSGTRTSFTDVGHAGTAYAFASPPPPTSITGQSASGAPTDPYEEEINQLFRELQFSVGTPYTAAVMRDVVEAIEMRALVNVDPHARDTFLEQRIRDVLMELSHTTNEQSLLLAVNLIEALIPVPYTSPQHKCTRLCRSLSVLLQCGLERAAREAQRVFKLLLELDLSFQSNSDAPLKGFMPKELKDTCELALLQLHGRTQQTKAIYQAQYLAIMLSVTATAEVSPRYLAGPLRSQVIQLATILSGITDPVLRGAAYECLAAIFSHTSSLRHNEIVIESRRVCEDSLRTLNTNHHNESAIVSALKALRALLSSRGLQAVDKQVMPQLCVVVAEQQRVSKSSLVRTAVCDLVPIIAPVDISSSPRRSIYVAIIMEPVKNVRNERSKSQELGNVAAFISSVGYEVLDNTNRTNLDSILQRYVSRAETQEACWGVIAAICSSCSRNSNSPHPSALPSKSSRQTICTNGTDTTFTESPRAQSITSVAGASTPHASPGPSSGNSNHATNARHYHGGTCSGSERSPTNTTASGGKDEAEAVGAASPTAITFRMPAIISQGGGGVEEMVRRGIQFIATAALSEGLVGHLTSIQHCVPSVSAEIQQALDRLVDLTLKDPIVFGAGSTPGAPSSPSSTAAYGPGTGMLAGKSAALADSSSGMRAWPRGHTTLDSSAGATPSTVASSDTTSSATAMRRFTQYFRTGGSSSAEPPAVSPFPSAAGAMSRHFTDSPSATHHTPSPANPALDALSRPPNAAPQHFTSPNDGPLPHFSPCTSTSPSHQHQQPPPPPPLQSDITVGLQVFARRPVTSVQQLEEIKAVITPFQAHESPKVRRQSSRTIIVCLSQWVRYAKEHKTSTYSTRVTEVLEAFVKNVLLEIDPACRLEEIHLLSSASNLRPFLSEQRILSALLSFLNGTPQVREKTVELLVAITQDPKPSTSIVVVQQSLYVTIESCVVVLEYTNDVHTLVKSMVDLQTFTRLCVRPLSNHLGRIFYAFRKKFAEDNIADVVSLSMLKTLETILQALTREEKTVLQYQDDVAELYPSVVEILKQTSSPALSHTAISVLVYMCRMCTCPMQASIQQKHELISALTHVYTSTSSSRSGLLNMLTLFGQFGAVDPSIKAVSTTVKKNEEAVIQDEADLELTYDYTVIVYRTLSRMLDVSLSEAVCIQALRTLLQFMRYTQDRKDQIGGVHGVRAVLQVAKRASDSPTLRIEALHVLAAITALRHERIARLLLPEIVVLLEQLWFPSDHALFRGVLEVVSALKPGKLSGKEQSESWAWLYPRLVDVALQDRTESREFCLRVVEIILNASYIPPHCIPIIFPVLVQFLQLSDQLAEVRSQSLCAAVHVVCELKATQYFPSLLNGIRTLTRHCELNEDLGPRLSTPSVRESFKVLSALHPSGRPIIKQLRDKLGDPDDRIMSGPLGSSVLFAHGRSGSAGAVAATAAASLGRGSTTSTGMDGGVTHSNSKSTNHGSSGAYLRHTHSESFSGDEELSMNLTGASGGQDISAFMKHIEWGLRTKEDKLREWFADLQKCIILVSPHPAFRMMVDLFDKHEPLRRELFHPSFKSLYEALTVEQIRKVNEVLTTVLNCNDNELVSKCLGLADYLDHNQPNIKSETLEALRALEHTDHRVVYSSETDSLAIHSNRSTSSVFTGSLSARGGGSSAHARRSHQGHEGVVSVRGSTSARQVHDSVEASSATGDAATSDAATRQGTQLETNESTFVFESESHSFAATNNGDLAPGEQSTITKKLSGRGTHNPTHSQTQHGRGRGGGTESFSNGDGGAGTFLTYIHPLYRPTAAAAAARRKSQTKIPKAAWDVMQMEAHTPFKPNILFSSENIVKAAERTHMYDKALSYLENKLLAAQRAYRYTTVPWEVVKRVVWPLAWLYNQRGMHDSVVGLFQAIRYKGENSDGFGLELLRWWGEAQRAYAKAIDLDCVMSLSVSPRLVEGYVRTLCFCGEWSKALAVAKQVCYSVPFCSSTVASCGAMSAWVLRSWGDVSKLAECISTAERSNGMLRLFYLNGAHLHSAIRDNTSAAYEAVRQSLTQSKVAMDESLRTLLPLSYSHAYENLTMLQHFNEMEELIDYSHCRSTRVRAQLVDRWSTRFIQLKPDSLQPSLRSLMIHSLVLTTNEMSNTILHFCETMSADYPQLAQWAMNWLRQSSADAIVSPASKDKVPAAPAGDVAASASPHSKLPREASATVRVGFISHMWAQGRRAEAVSRMEAFLLEIGNQLKETDAACYGGAQLRLGTWKQELHADSFWKKDYREEELGHFHEAIRAVPSSYEAWHSWGLINYRVQQRDNRLTLEEQRTFVEAAHQGFVASICRCKCSAEALSGVMRLLQLWVIHNGVAFLKETVADSISRIPVDHWVQAIPQLIGHLSNESHDVREVIGMILRSLCEVHPQAVVFPLLVVAMSDELGYAKADKLSLRRQALVQSIIQHCPKRIRSEAEQVAKLLVDVSAIPIEKIRENLCQVATAWNPNAEYEEDADEVRHRLKAILEIFHANRKHLLYTVGDIGQFVQMVIDDEHRGDREKAASTVNQLADEVTKHVSEKLGKEPQKAMEPLLKLRNLSIAVFGEYDINYPDFPTIASFSSKLDVIPSKKRPRRIQLNGSDGCLYAYCLKGNEDIRMDERVLQLFGLVNVLLSHGRTANSAYIHRFPVIPISSNVGLLGWVENANTINNTICNYRTTISHVRTHHETSILRSYVESFGHWDKLSVIQRTEALDYVMQNESCQAIDISRAMWHRANTAEQWLDRRTAFTTSMASMSMVGYVMGLGDRHLGNILLSMSTGKIVHIDFGDSFDVGRLRHVLPETIPFRLTRMLTNAMEVFGVNGVFRASATRTQGILHRNRDSIMALLSAFVYDPIVQHKGKMKNMMEKSRSPQEVAERIRNKLRGMEMAVSNSEVTPLNTTPESCRRPDLLYMSKAFDDCAMRVQSMTLSPEQQVSFLIEEATRTDNYSTLYFGWGPLW